MGEWHDGGQQPGHLSRQREARRWAAGRAHITPSGQTREHSSQPKPWRTRAEGGGNGGRDLDGGALQDRVAREGGRSVSSKQTVDSQHAGQWPGMLPIKHPTRDAQDARARHGSIAGHATAGGAPSGGCGPRAPHAAAAQTAGQGNV